MEDQKIESYIDKKLKAIDKDISVVEAEIKLKVGILLRQKEALEDEARMLKKILREAKNNVDPRPETKLHWKHRQAIEQRQNANKK